MPRKVEPLLVSQRRKLRLQRAQKEADRKQRNADQYEKEKASRPSGYGYSANLKSPSSTFTNTSAIRREQRTFEEFMSLLEGKKKKSFEPQNVTINPETGSRSYTLPPADPDKQGPFTKKQVFNILGPMGRKAIEKAAEKREKELKKLRKKNKIAP